MALLARNLTAVLRGAGFRLQEATDESAHYVRADTRGRPPLSAWCDRTGVMVWGPLPPGAPLEEAFGVVTVLPHPVEGPPVAVEVVPSVVLCPAAIAGAVRRVSRVQDALWAGQAPPRSAIPATEQRARGRALTRRQAGRVEEGRVQLMYVFADADRPSLAYTVGCVHLYGHPELIVLSLGRTAACGLLHLLADRIKGGAVFKAGDLIADAANFPLRIAAVPDQAVADVAPAAARFARSRDEKPTALHVVYPDAAGRFPEEAAYDLPARAQDLAAVAGGGALD